MNLIPLKPVSLHDFDGGIHPAENKHQSTSQPIRPVPLPDELVLPLLQHIGNAAVPVVSVGDQVLKGQKIALDHGFVSAPLHAPTSGTVSAIEDRLVPHASGLSELCIVITPDGKDEWTAHQSLAAELGLSSADALPKDAVLSRIRDCGIAGMGGAGFPTSVKLNPGNRRIDTLVLNAAECEPYITSDDLLLRERAASVVRGAQIMLDLLDAPRCLVGIEDNKPEAAAALQAAIANAAESSRILAVVIPTKYPSGGEKQLIQILTGREVPSGGIPADVGIVCQNVATAAAVAEAVDQGRPLIGRITTLTGDAMTNKGNFDVLFGTPVSHLLAVGGYQPQKHERVIMGGPMMGFTLPDTSVPVVKTTNCLLAPTEKELPLNNPATACIRCGLCAQACPAGLLPQQLYWFSRAQEFDKAEQHNLFDCIECGACSYVCPSSIPLVQYYRYAKGAIHEERLANLKSEQARERFENRLARQEREQAEKEAKRKARAEAAAKAQATKSAEPVADSASAAPASAAKAEVSAEDTERKILAQKDRIAKATERLNAAQEQGLDTVDALAKGVAKQEEKLAELEKMLAGLKSSSTPASAPAPVKPELTVEDLEKKILAQKDRLAKATERLNTAQEQGLDTVDALAKGVARQEEKLADLEQTLNGLRSTTETTSGENH
ncbi:MAG: electron transport complex subunit RsxC [Oceanospirillaceae bacterium]|nr:electron transport complex subunit RsxC [Oceanospirillaceae bacterium]|tara:strand:- start:24974 stop:26974 length:2001 start_codon:yes stop_codon:yes gene_type:complete